MIPTIAPRSLDNKATIDFETRSACDLLACGASVYSEHETTEAMYLAYKLPGQEVRRWHMAHPQHGIEEAPPPQDLFDWIAAGGLVEAHNAFFERMIWKNVMVARHGWPEVPHEQWRCSAAKASSFALPRALGAAGQAIGLPVTKDDAGRRVMLKMCKPRKPKKKERAELAAQGLDPDEVLLWHEDLADIYILWAYCDRDVEAEHALSLALRDLPPTEQELWLMDQYMNERGVYVDVAMARGAVRLAEREVERLNAELCDLTGGEVERASSRIAFKDWVNRQGCPLPDTQGPTLEEFAASEEWSPVVRSALRIVRDVNRTSIAKYQAMLDRVSADHTIKDTMMYHGASTGRWSGKGVQPHNFPRGTIKEVGKAWDHTCEVVAKGDREWLEMVYGPGSALEVLSCTLRGALMARPGKKLMVADYAAIEARVVFWLAGCQSALDVFERGEDIYCDMATGIYGYKVVKSTHPDERQMGKQAILGLGFGMGFLTFLLTCRKYNIIFTKEQVRAIVRTAYSEVEERVRKYFLDDKRRPARLVAEGLDFEGVMHEMVLMQFVVDKYRAQYPEVKEMWGALERAAISAVQNRGSVVRCGLTEWKLTGRFLHCKLPSGRLLSYADPRVTQAKTPWGSTTSKLRFMGVDPYTKKWCLQDIYGGLLTENVVQAVARDLMASAMLAAHRSPDYELVMSVHDELVCEVDALKHPTVKQFEALMSTTPSWAKGCPVEAEGWCGKRYRK